MKIMYIHGFGSSFSLNSNKVKKLLKHFEVVGINLENKPENDIKKLKEFYNKEKPEIIIGTSLGAFYSYYLSSIFDTYCFLINPITTPSNQLKYHLGTNISYKDKKEFNFTEKDLLDLLKLENNLKHIDKIDMLTNVYYANKDNKLNINEIKEIFKNSILYEYDSNDHRFHDNFDIVVKDLIDLKNSIIYNI